MLPDGAGDRGLVSFDRTMCGNLHRPTQPIHDVRRTTQRVPGAEHPSDQLRQPRQSPPLITTEPVRRRALFQGVGQPPRLGLILATPRSWRYRDAPGPFEARACSPPARHPYTAVCDTQAGGRSPTPTHPRRTTGRLPPHRLTLRPPPREPTSIGYLITPTYNDHQQRSCRHTDAQWTNPAIRGLQFVHIESGNSPSEMATRVKPALLAIPTFCRTRCI